ncbi:MAG TPA: hypothetical protein VL463_32480 [Kofleriaceae bacterium]|nr:hypothetical protein [Kofleriaceae bacterium]
MGALDEASFERIVKACSACGGTSLELRAYLDRRFELMLGDPNDDGRWAYDGEKFIDGVYRVACTSCGKVAHESHVCPRCNAADALPAALDLPTRAMPPKRCPSCRATELTMLAFVPAVVVSAGGRPPPPKPLAELGDPGFHVISLVCEECGPIDEKDTCPICDAPGPLRERP